MLLLSSSMSLCIGSILDYSGCTVHISSPPCIRHCQRLCLWDTVEQAQYPVTLVYKRPKVKKFRKILFRPHFDRLGPPYAVSFMKSLPGGFNLEGQERECSSMSLPTTHPSFLWSNVRGHWTCQGHCFPVCVCTGAPVRFATVFLLQRVTAWAVSSGGGGKGEVVSIFFPTETWCVKTSHACSSFMCRVPRIGSCCWGRHLREGWGLE